MAWPLYLAPALPRLTALQRNLGLDLASAVGLGTTMAVVGVLLPSVARREGLDSMGLAALAALPFLASLLTLFAGRIGPRTPARLAVIRALGAVGLLLVLIAPHPIFIAAATLGFWVSFALGAPLQQRIWATVYPTADRGRLLGYVGTGRFAAGTVALFAITLVAASSGWAPILVLVVAAGAASSLAVSRMTVPDIEVNHSFSAVGSIRSVVGTPMLRSIAIGQLLFGGGLVAAPALIAMVHVDRLGLGLEDIALAGLLSYGTTAVTIGLWSRLAGRFGAITTIAAGALIGAAGLGVFAAAPNFGIVVLATVMVGIADAAVNASWPLLISDHAPMHEQGAVAAGMNAIMGMRGLVTPFLVMVPVYAGLVDETGGLFICLVVSATGALAYARLAGFHVPAELRRSARTAVQWRPASSLMPAASTSGWPVIRRSRLMRSSIAGWVLKRPRALLSSFLTGLTT